MDDTSLLDAEVVRAMSGRPAWRVVAACVNGGACPRCGAAISIRCKTIVTCNERVWAQRARERAAGKMQRGRQDGAHAFIAAIAEHRISAEAHVSRTRNGGWCWPSAWNCAPIDTLAMDAAIACGYVRLINSGGPVWVVTEHAVEQAAALAVAVQDVQADAPSAPSVDALAAVAAFHARTGMMRAED